MPNFSIVFFEKEKCQPLFAGWKLSNPSNPTLRPPMDLVDSPRSQDVGMDPMTPLAQPRRGTRRPPVRLEEIALE